MPKTLLDLPPHSVRSLMPPLGVLEEMGFGRQDCLRAAACRVKRRHRTCRSSAYDHYIEHHSTRYPALTSGAHLLNDPAQ